MSTENLDESQLEESTGVGDAFSQRLILEESLSLVEENDVSTVDETQNPAEPVTGDKNQTIRKESKSEPEESKEIISNKNINDQIEETKIGDEIAEKKVEDNIVEEKTEEMIIEKDTEGIAEVNTHETKDNTGNGKLESQDMFENDTEKMEIIELDKSSLESNEEVLESDSSRKRKASDDDSSLPTKQKKSESDNDKPEISTIETATVNFNSDEKVKSNSSNDSTVSYSVLSGKINLTEYEKTLSNSTKEPSSSVEIIENSSEESSIIDLAKDSNSSIDLRKSEEIKEPEVSNGEVTDKVMQEAETEPVETEELLNSSPTISKVSSDVEKPEVRLSDRSIPHLLNKTDTISPIVQKSSPSSTQNGDTSTPNMDNYRNDDSKSKNEISTRRQLFYVEVTYTVTEADMKKEVSSVVCEDITDISINSYKRVSDVSAGALGDISKNTSPSSTASVAPFSLPNRYSTISNSSRLSTLSRYSTSSTSSLVSSASALAGRTSLLRNEENFLIPEIPLNKIKDKSLLDSKSLSADQILSIKSHWGNSDQLFKILDAIDHCTHSMNVSAISNDNHSPISEHVEDNDALKSEKLRTPEKKLESIVEINTPKSQKRSMRKKRIPKSLTDTGETSEVATPTSSNRVRGARKTKRSNTIEQEEDSKLSSISSGHFSSGQVVFARWTDRKYYSGVIQEHVRDNKWNVKFDDGSTKTLIEDYILAECQTLLKGHSVYALIKKTGEYETGIVSELWVERGKVKYKVETDNGVVVKVFADELFLTEDQAKTVKEINRIATPPGTPKLGLVSLENIVEGKRATRSNRKYANAFSPRPGVSGTRKLTPRKLDSEDEKSIDSRSECALEEIGGVEPELKNLSTPAKANKGPGKVKGTVKTSTRLPKYKLDDDIFGPIPENSDVFNGLSFILVCANSLVTNKTNESEKTASESDTDYELKEFTKIPFLEERLVQQIVGGGGILYQHFEDIPPGDYDMCKLISNRPNKTAKYIQCIAAGITILSHEWIVRSCRENKRLPFQELPIGWSLERKTFFDSFQRKKDKPFQDLLIFLAPNVDKQFLKFWERVCSLAGGTVIVMTSEDVDFQTATLLLADNDCPESVVDRALNWSVPLLSTSWVIQSLIHGEARPFDAHSKYAYDFIDEED